MSQPRATALPTIVDEVGGLTQLALVVTAGLMTETAALERLPFPIDRVRCAA